VNNSNQNNSTGFGFLLIFVLFAAAILISGYFAYRHYEQNYRVEVEDQLSSVAKLKVDQLVQYRRERLADANILFSNPPFSNLVRRFFEKTSNAEVRGQLYAWLAKYQLHYQ
jgi:hypothetical protein